MKKNQQSSVFRGIYEFEDPSGCLIAAKTPHIGSADLYSGTAVVVRPNQCAMFLYKGQIADILLKGIHKVKTENVPILTRLANWRFGFKSPLRAEIWFFSSQVYTARRWGTAQPILSNFSEVGTVPIRGFGNYDISLIDPIRFYKTLIGSKVSYDISELEDFVQGRLVEQLPAALTVVKDIQTINTAHAEVAKTLKSLVNKDLKKYGLKLQAIQVLSLLPSKEILQALDTKMAMNIVGDKQEFLLYQAANSLNELQAGGGNTANDPMQMMLGMMLGKNLMTSDYRAKEHAQLPKKKRAQRQRTSKAKAAPPRAARTFCTNCGAQIEKSYKFCSSCGAKVQ